ncbi:sec1 family domain-containing 2 [Brachionus plicatilis]|uniref:Sec1 family domain-containing 2 n=1 Tax=Brachionus plicatilis TaxID=10195 RepID=A0A3M7T1T4_BRAPC|nr:sec1 family domain-containing 2 [Brachionus plicatilis]
MSSQINVPSIDKILQKQYKLNDKILKKLNKSIVFADYQFLEWFNLTVGIDQLIKKAGVVNIKKFSSLENGGHHLKAVFFISQPLKGLVVEILKDILTSSTFQFITIVTNLHPNFYGISKDLFDQLRDDCLIWMSDANYACDIFYEKFPFAILTNNQESNLFLNPLSSWSLNSKNFNQFVSIEVYNRLVKQEVTDLHALSPNNPVNKDNIQNLYLSLTESEINEFQAIANSLNEMLEHLDSKDDCFTLGVLSSIIANELNQSSDSKLRRKNSPNKVTLLLIDRNMDLSMNALFHEETIFDKINNIMVNLNPQSNDVQIDLRNFLFENNFKSILPGNYFHTSTEKCDNLIQTFFSLKPKECLLDVYRKLCEIFPINESGKKAVRINSESIKSQIRNGIKTNKKAFMEHLDLVQIICAYCQISDSQIPRQQSFDKLISFSKSITQNILDKDGPSVLSRLYAFFSEKLEQNDQKYSYSISDLILILIYVYGLIGEECYYGVEEEERIKKLLITELQSKNLDNDSKFKCDLEFFNKIREHQNFSQLIDSFFQNLKNLKNYRKNLKEKKELIKQNESNNHYSYKPLISQICENIIDTATDPDQLTDLEYRTSGSEGLGINLLKSFKMGFMSTSNKPHPLNNDFIIIYIIGGISSYEYKLVKELFNQGSLSEKKVLIGSSHFYNHEKLIKHLMS